MGGKESVRGVARTDVPCRNVAKLPRNQKVGDLKIVQGVGFCGKLTNFVGIYRYLSLFDGISREKSENVGIYRQVRLCNVNFGLQDLNSSFALDVTDASDAK